MSKFVKGQSGNVRGRPAGRTAGARLRKAIEERADDLLGVVIDMAMAGDLAACSLLLNRIVPPLKAVTPTVSVPATGDASLLERANSIIDETMQGNLSPDVATQLMGALANLGKIIESTELETRLENLERLLENRK